MCICILRERERERERGPGRLSSFWAKHWPESRSLQDHVMDQPFQSTQKSIWASNPFEAFLYSSINPKQKSSASSFHKLWFILIWVVSVCSSYLAIWVISRFSKKKYGLSPSLDIWVDVLVFNIVLSYVSNAPMFALSDTTTFSK